MFVCKLLEFLFGRNRRPANNTFFSTSIIIFAKICISDDYNGFILLFVHPAGKADTGSPAKVGG